MEAVKVFFDGSLISEELKRYSNRRKHEQEKKDNSCYHGSDVIRGVLQWDAEGIVADI